MFPIVQAVHTPEFAAVDEQSVRCYYTQRMARATRRFSGKWAARKAAKEAAKK